MRTSMFRAPVLAAPVLAALVLVPFLVGCGRTQAPPAAHEEPAHLEAIAGDESRHRITLTARAAERLGIEVAEVTAAPGASGSVRVPYSSVIYDAEGASWAYVVESELVFVRQPVTVADVQPGSGGGLAVLSAGPTAGTAVVSVGVAELFGTEFEVGH